jgi:hypothetical protein
VPQEVWPGPALLLKMRAGGVVHSAGRGAPLGAAVPRGSPGDDRATSRAAPPGRVPGTSSPRDRRPRGSPRAARPGEGFLPGGIEDSSGEDTRPGGRPRVRRSPQDPRLSDGCPGYRNHHPEFSIRGGRFAPIPQDPSFPSRGLAAPRTGPRQPDRSASRWIRASTFAGSSATARSKARSASSGLARRSYTTPRLK